MVSMTSEIKNIIGIIGAAIVYYLLQKIHHVIDEKN
jgi:hypothetical protein